MLNITRIFQIMKRVAILLISLFCFSLSQAQKLEFGLNGGVGFNSIPKNSTDSVLPKNSSLVVNYAFSLKMFTNVGKWQLGIGADFQKISRKTPDTKFIFGNPAVPVYVMINRRLGSRFYAGVDGGFLFVSNANKIQYLNNNQITPQVVYYEPGHGYSAGAHIGAIFNLGAHFDFNAELGGKYGKYSYSYRHVDAGNHITTGSDKYSYFSPSLTVGLRLKLFTDRFRQW